MNKSAPRDAAVNEIGRRLAAAYTSYIIGHKGVDRLLKRTPRRAGALWYELARVMFDEIGAVPGSRPGNDIRLRKVITKYIQ